MAAFNGFHQFLEDLAHGVHDLENHTLKLALTNTAPTAASDGVFQDISEIAPGDGYTAGGEAIDITASGQSSGLYKLVGDDVEFQADGGSFGPFRYVVLYNDSPSSPAKPLIGWWDHGTEVTLNDGEKFTVDFDETDGILQISLS